MDGFFGQLINKREEEKKEMGDMITHVPPKEEPGYTIACKIWLQDKDSWSDGRRREERGGGEDSMGTNLRVELQHGLLDELHSAVLIPTWQ